MDKALKSQHGSERARWPAEAVRQLQEPDDRVTLAMSDWTYRSLRRRDPERPLSVGDSVDDIKAKGVAGLVGDLIATHYDAMIAAKQVRLAITCAS